MKNLILTLIIMMCLICGCANVRRNLIEDHYGKYTYQLDTNYQLVYKIVLEQIRTGYNLVWIGNSSTIENDLYTDLKYGEIRANNTTMLTGEWCPIHIMIKETENNKSEMIVYTSKHGFHECFDKSKFDEWIKGIEEQSEDKK